MRYLKLIACILITGYIHGAQYTIGPNEMFKTPNELYLDIESGTVTLNSGDTINIVEGSYRGTDVLAVWRVDSLLIRGVGGMAHLYADGQYIIGKGIFVSAGNDITYENIGFYDASVPDQNGAGIRLDGSGLTVRRCLFYNNENGILANNSEEGRVLIEYSEFAVGGFGDGFSHNIYINHCASLTVQFCYFHQASVGHQIKSRADQNLIQYNRIADLNGNSSRLIDIPNGGQSIILGNELIQGQNAENNNLIGYGLEGLSNPGPHTIHIVHNTILNYRTASCVYFHTADGTDSLIVMNNILGGPCSLSNGLDPLMLNNLVEEDISAVKFLDEEEMNYFLREDSPAIDIGIDIFNTSLLPKYEYIHPLSMIHKETIGLHDVGAHDANLIINVNEEVRQIRIFPNPVQDEITITGIDGGKYQIYQLDGKLIQSGFGREIIDVSELISGIYILAIQNQESVKFIKE